VLRGVLVSYNIAIIPARGGSVRIPGKNIREFHGKPIIAYAIEAAQTSGLFRKVVVSSDDGTIMRIAHELGAEDRFREQDDGTKGTQEVARDVLMSYRAANMACVIYPCSPFLTANHLIDAYQHLIRNPYLHYAMSVTDPLADAGCFYFGAAESFKARKPLLGKYTAMIPMVTIDINTEEDFKKAEKMYEAMK
jgi:pseudaminic acid cytidylyltransferase